MQRRSSAARSRVLRYGLAGFLAFVALNAFGGGLYGMAGARGVPREWLAGTPFSSYFVPSVILFLVVGGSLAYASVATWLQLPHARRMAFVASVVLVGWIAVQVAMIGLVSWLQPLVGIAGAAIALLSTVATAGKGRQSTRRAAA